MSVAIMNMALDLLEEEPILTAEDDRTAVRWMNRNFGSIRDALLRQHPWRFAIRRAALPLLSDAPAFGWQRQYELPADCLRILPLSGAQINGRDVPFTLEGQRILTNAAGPVAISYVARVEEAGEMDPMFVRALATSVAAEAASFIAGKASLAELLTKKADALVMRAQMVSALETTPAQASGDDWLDGRYGYGEYDAYR
jgi:hypothetical protein